MRKIEGAISSIMLDCHFMHSNTAMHGDLGMVSDGDLVILLTKSDSTVESVMFYEQIKRRDYIVWLLPFSRESILYNEIKKHIAIELKHEEDKWNIMPNNLNTINLIILQKLAMQLAIRISITLTEFKKNHPGRAIGKAFSNT